MSIKEAAEAVLEAMDFKGEVVVSFHCFKLVFVSGSMLETGMK